MERELGIYLLERKNRKFSLTPAGEYFYKKSLVLIADFEQMCREAGRLAKDDKAVLVIGYLRCYSGQAYIRLLTDKGGPILLVTGGKGWYQNLKQVAERFERSISQSERIEARRQALWKIQTETILLLLL